jgi:hypothetical protein
MEALALVLALAREINGVGSFQLTMFSRYRRSPILPKDVGGARYVCWTVVEQNFVALGSRDPPMSTFSRLENQSSEL